MQIPSEDKRTEKGEELSLVKFGKVVGIPSYLKVFLDHFVRMIVSVPDFLENWNLHPK